MHVLLFQCLLLRMSLPLAVTPDRIALSTMDVVAVLTKVVQEQQKTIADLNEKVTRLEQQVK